MRTRSLFSEGLRNIGTGTSRAAMLALAFVALVGGLAIFDVRGVVAVLQSATTFRDAGAAVQILEASDDAVVGTRCDGLGVGGALEAAGALRVGEEVSVSTLPSAEITVWEVSPGFIELLQVSTVAAHGSASGGVWLADDLAETLGVTLGNEVATTRGAVTVDGVFAWPDDGRARNLAYSIVAPVAINESFDQCWGSVWPPSEATAGLLHSVVESDAEDAVLGQLNSTLGANYNGPEILASRISKWTPLAAAAVGLAIGLAAMRIRRLEFSSALHSGQSKGSLLWQQVIEACAWLCAAVIVASAGVAFAAELGNPESFVQPFLIGTTTVAVGALGTLIGTLIGTSVIMERHLFRYVKDR